MSRNAITYRGARRNMVRANHDIRKWPKMGHVAINHKGDTIRRVTYALEGFEFDKRWKRHVSVGPRRQQIAHVTYALTMQTAHPT